MLMSVCPSVRLCGTSSSTDFLFPQLYLSTRSLSICIAWDRADQYFVLLIKLTPFNAILVADTRENIELLQDTSNWPFWAMRRSIFWPRALSSRREESYLGSIHPFYQRRTRRLVKIVKANMDLNLTQFSKPTLCNRAQVLLLFICTLIVMHVKQLKLWQFNAYVL